MRLKLATRLTLLNVMICLGIGLILAIQFISYKRVEALLGQISHDLIMQVVCNAQNGRDLAGILADINLLTRTFYEQDDHLKLMSGNILSNLGRLAEANREPLVAEKIRQFTFFTRSFVEQCQIVNTILAERREIQKALHRYLNSIESIVADQMIEPTLAGKHAAYIEQTSLLIFGYRERLLNIGKRFAELGYDHFADPVPSPRRPIQDLLDDLQLRLRPLTAADPGVKKSVTELRQGIDRYKANIDTLYSVMHAFGTARQELRDSQQQLLNVMADVDHHLSESASHLDHIIKTRLRHTGAVVSLLALAILAGLIVASSILLVKHVKAPMEAIQTGIANFSRGLLETPIDLKRQDEWGVIESALNRMAQDLLASYTALEISESSYRSIFENVTEGIYQSVTSTDGSHFTKANPAMAHLLGYATPEEVIQAYSDLNTQLFADPEDRLRLVSILRERESVSGFECRLKKRTGERIWVAIGARLIMDEGQTRYTIEGTMVDISVRKQAEEEMLRLRNLLKSMMDAMPSVLVAVDAEVCVTQWNREAERLTGTSADRALGRFLGDVFPQIADQETRIRDAIAHRPFEPQATVTLTVNGVERINDITVYPLSEEGINGVVIRLDDVTDRIRMKEMMIQSEKMLSVGGLAAGMAHEINNPLAGILQNAQVIENRLLGQLSKNTRTAAQCGIDMAALGRYLEARRIPEMLASVSDSGKRAARIVDNMLSFARKGDSARSAVDLAALMDLTLELAENDYDLKRRLDFRHIHILKEYDPTLPPVPCNSSKIQQVLLNLLRNGAQAMAAKPRRGDGVLLAAPPQFNLRLCKRGEMARIEIQDNGPGMDEATRKRVFEPFYTTKDVGVGTGLGLSVSYFIITENHKGSLTVMSQPGKGSTFAIELPMNPS